MIYKIKFFLRIWIIFNMLFTLSNISHKQLLFVMFHFQSFLKHSIFYIYTISSANRKQMKIA